MEETLVLVKHYLCYQYCLVFEETFVAGIALSSHTSVKYTIFISEEILAALISVMCMSGWPTVLLNLKNCLSWVWPGQTSSLVDDCAIEVLCVSYLYHQQTLFTNCTMPATFYQPRLHGWSCMISLQVQRWLFRPNLHQSMSQEQVWSWLYKYL